MKKISAKNVAYLGGDPEPEDFSYSSKKRRNRLGIIVEVNGGKGKAIKKLTRRKSAFEHHSSVDARRQVSPKKSKNIDVTEIDDFSSHSSFESKSSNKSRKSPQPKNEVAISPPRKISMHLNTESRNTSPTKMVQQETVSKLSVISSKEDNRIKARFKKTRKRKENKSPPKLMMSQQLALDKPNLIQQETVSRKELENAINNIISIESGKEDSEVNDHTFDDRSPTSA